MEKHKSKRSKYIIIAVLLFLLSIIFFIYSSLSQNKINEKHRILNEGSIAFGVYDESGSIIDNPRC